MGTERRGNMNKHVGTCRSDRKNSERRSKGGQKWVKLSELSQIADEGSEQPYRLHQYQEAHGHMRSGTGELGQHPRSGTGDPNNIQSRLDWSIRAQNSITSCVKRED